jgi:AraC family transcriptional regulator
MVDRVSFEFAFTTGQSYYLALHDIRRSDGETVVDGAKRIRENDIRNKMTFLPANCSVSGWASPARKTNSFTALLVRPEALAEAFENNPPRDPPPRLYFENDNLRMSMLKLETLLREGDPDVLHADTLGLLIGIELLQLTSSNPCPEERGNGPLSDLQGKRIVDFINENLASRLGLADLAAVAGLSQFHFARAFRVRFGISPLKFVTQRRIDRARDLLKQSDLSIAQIGMAVGFKGVVQFGRAFARVTGVTPSEYRRSF